MSLSLLVLAACGSGSNTESPSPGASAGESPSAEESSGTLQIAVVPKAVGFDYWTHVKAGAECAASKLDGVNVEWNGVSAETDITQQVDMLNGYINQHVDGLIYAATDSKALVSVTKNAQDAKIPVFNIDSGTDPQNVPIFATDNIAGAKHVAKLMNQYLDGKGTVALIEFQPGSMTNDQRKKGFTTGLKDYPGLELVADQADGSDANKALTVANNILTAHPDLDGIFGSNEPSVIGASQAVKQRGLSGKITLVGWDAAPDEVKSLGTGEISALIVQNPFRMGFDSVVAMVQHIRNGVEVKSEDTGIYAVTTDNMNEEKYQAILDPSCSNPPLPDDDPWLQYVQ
ncbi:ABC transporter substrate-binding protein [Pseudactinotalea sp. HY160]|uniref:ABC transporter substrate-binding protein n=1 Tax=Pseudactinotalea sp. HY160 TaxID=2654490 RepID=UPI0018833A8A|nr:ABC transporter substrate-binding protein [Pseudactinotalea sp. HY160]